MIAEDGEKNIGNLEGSRWSDVLTVQHTERCVQWSTEQQTGGRERAIVTEKLKILFKDIWIVNLL